VRTAEIFDARYEYFDLILVNQRANRFIPVFENSWSVRNQIK